MQETRTLLAALALAGTTALGGGVAAAAGTDATSAGTMDLEGLTCQKLLDVDSEMQQRIVYWLDGYTQAGNAVYQVERDWMEAPVANIVTECKRAPERTASEVVREQRQIYGQ